MKGDFRTRNFRCERKWQESLNDERVNPHNVEILFYKPREQVLFNLKSS